MAVKEILTQEEHYELVKACPYRLLSHDPVYASKIAERLGAYKLLHVSVGCEEYILPLAIANNKAVSFSPLWAGGILPLNRHDHILEAIDEIRKYIKKNYPKYTNVTMMIPNFMPFYESLSSLPVTNFQLGAYADVDMPYADYWNNTYTNKSRNMVRKADKLFTYRLFDRNDYLTDIYEINTSKPIRQGPMSEGYLEQPKASSNKLSNYATYQQEFVGAFKDGKLVAYINALVCGRIYIFNQILGHNNYLKDGVMNGLVDYAVKLGCNSGRVKYLYYVHFGNPKIDMFRKTVGFKPVNHVNMVVL